MGKLPIIIVHKAYLLSLYGTVDLRNLSLKTRFLPPVLARRFVFRSLQLAAWYVLSLAHRRDLARSRSPRFSLATTRSRFRFIII